MKKLLTIFTLATVLFTGCKKIDYDLESKGEALGPLKLSAPLNGTVLALNAATPTVPVNITWTASTPGVNTKPTYKWVAALKTGNIESPILEIPSNNNGNDTKLTLTFGQIDAALASKGIAANVATDLVWSVVADNGSIKVRSADLFSIKITRFGNGTTPFLLLGPTSSTSTLAIDPGSTSSSFNFNWTKSKPSTGGPAVTYRVLFVEQKYDANGAEIPVNWSNPLFSIASNSAGVDSVGTMTYKAVSDSLTAKGFTNLSAATSLKWTAVATSGTWKQQSDYVNDLVILRKVRMYMPGGYQGATGNGNDWDPPTAPELIADTRAGANNNLYYIYIYLPAGANFKITEGRAWATAYGSTGATTASTSGGNFSVGAAGYYRISLNRTAGTYDIRAGRMGFVGGATPTGWNPPSVFPANTMANAGTNLFIGLTTFTSGGWKLIDSDAWDNGSQAVNETRSFGGANTTSGSLVTNGPNFPDFATAGRNRVIWDGRDVDNPKYSMSPGTEMRIVGDGINGVAAWTPGVSPTMNYTGNGIWTKSLALIANKDIKFLGGNDWPNAANGFIDYEDNSGGSQAVGTPRKIQWEGGNNFRTPAVSGTYTITLNENNQTVTIN
jgi:starch-binding outer membrane protein SusE/F